LGGLVMSGEKGILLEVEGTEGVALTRDGAFVRTRVPEGAEVGQEVRLRPVRSFRVSPVLVAAAVVLLALMPAVLPVMAPSPAEAVALVTVDINPSLEMQVNGDGTVLGARALDEEGEALLTSLDPVGRAVEEAIEAVVARAVDMGFLVAGEEAQTVIISGQPVSDEPLDEEVARGLERAREKTAQVLSKRGVGAAVGVLKVNAEVKEKARQAGVSVGELALILASREAGLNLSVEDVSKKGIGRAIMEAGGRPEEVLKKIKEASDLGKLLKKYAKELKDGPAEVNPPGSLKKEKDKSRPEKTEDDRGRGRKDRPSDDEEGSSPEELEVDLEEPEREDEEPLPSREPRSSREEEPEVEEEVESALPQDPTEEEADEPEEVEGRDEEDDLREESPEEVEVESEEPEREDEGQSSLGDRRSSEDEGAEIEAEEDSSGEEPEDEEVPTGEEDDRGPEVPRAGETEGPGGKD